MPALINFEEEIERFLVVYGSNPQSLVQFRAQKLKSILDHFRTQGYPRKCTLYELSLLPAYFQEAIYDGIDWYKQDTDLQHLQQELELDCMFQNKGKRRSELSSIEFEEYVVFSNMAISGHMK